MEFLSEAILLGRKPLGEYDESLIFLTKKAGKIRVYAPGIRSKNSRRRSLLTPYAWLQIYLQKEKKRFLLTEISLKKAIFPLFSDTETKAILPKHEKQASPGHIEAFGKLLFWSEKLLPFEDTNSPSFIQARLGKAKDKNFIDEQETASRLYKILQLLSQQAAMAMPLAAKKLLYPLVLLYIQGELRGFYGCDSCGQYCSRRYWLLADNSLVGQACEGSKSAMHAMQSEALESPHFKASDCSQFILSLLNKVHELDPEELDTALRLGNFYESLSTKLSAKQAKHSLKDFSTLASFMQYLLEKKLFSYKKKVD